MTEPPDPRSLTLSAFQAHISAKYEAADRAGDAGHLALVLGRGRRAGSALARDNRANLAGEFADVLAWLCTLANINDIDLAAAVTQKYLTKGALFGAEVGAAGAPRAT